MSRHSLKLMGKVWPTSEHCFQAMKFWPHCPELVERVREAPTGVAAAALGRDRTHPLRLDWEAYPEDGLWALLPFTAPLEVSDDLPRLEPAENLLVRVKDVFMFLALQAKFEQNPEIGQALKDTGTEVLIEDTAKDSYWGNGPTKRGHNKLGRLLMVLRGRL